MRAVSAPPARRLDKKFLRQTEWTYHHSRAVAGHVQALGPRGRVDAERHQQHGQTEHAQYEPPGPADPRSRVCNRERTEKTRVLNQQHDRMNQCFKRKNGLN